MTLKYRTRDEATKFLRGIGIPMGDTALAQLAADGRGPRYRVISKRALYSEADLTSWVDEQAKQPPVKASKRGRASDQVAA